MKTFKFLALAALVCGIGAAVAVSNGQTNAAEKTHKCEISGKDATDSKIAFDVNGQIKKLCCKGCIDPFKKKLALVTPEKLVCPISGKAADPKHTRIEKRVKKVSLCCPGCADPLAKKNKFVVKDNKPGKCKISGKQASDKVFLLFNGNKEFLCCEGCLDPFLKGLAAEDASEKCAISGKTADPKYAQYVVTHTLKGYCCGDCKAKDGKKNYKNGVYIGHLKDKAKGKDKAKAKAKAKKKL